MVFNNKFYTPVTAALVGAMSDQDKIKWINRLGKQETAINKQLIAIKASKEQERKELKNMSLIFTDIKKMESESNIPEEKNAYFKVFNNKNLKAKITEKVLERPVDPYRKKRENKK